MPPNSNTQQQADDRQAQLIIVMGVSGCGKSTVARALATRLGYEFIEADDFHSAKNRQYMKNGKALTDEMRAPWITSIQAHLSKLAEQHSSSVLSFSGLKANHRARIKSVPMAVTTLHLHGDRQIIQERIQKRANHFMPASLLDSQYQALENPNFETNTHAIDINCSVEEVVRRAITCLTIPNQPKEL